MFYKVIESLKTSWQESLAIFMPESLGRVILLSLRTLIQIYTTLPFAWFFPTALIAGLLFSEVSLLHAFYLVLIARAARPSIEHKRLSYWQHFTPVDWILFSFIYLIKMLPTASFLHDNRSLEAIYHLIAKLFLLEGYGWFNTSVPFKELIPFLSPFIIIWVLFMLDAQKTVLQYIKAFLRACTMMLYNYPFFIIAYSVMRLVLAGSFFLARFTSISVGETFLYILLLPLYVAFLTVFYVKRIHEQFGLYYKA